MLKLLTSAAETVSNRNFFLKFRSETIKIKLTVLYCEIMRRNLDIIIVGILIFVLFIIALKADFYESFYSYSRAYEEFELDEIVTFIFFGFFGMFFISIKRWIGTHKLKKRVEEQNKLLEKLNSDKDFLIREVHHRVKNNFSIISSLVSLHKNNTDNEAVKIVLNDVYTKLQSFLTLHEILYKNDIAKNVDMEVLLRRVFILIDESFEPLNVDLFLNIDSDVIFKMDIIIPFLLITSEAVLNSYKYAFTPDKDNKLSISLVKVNNGIKFEIEDNGPGFSIESVNPGKLGIILIQELSNQIDGNCKILSENGVKIHIFVENTATEE